MPDELRGKLIYALAELSEGRVEDALKAFMRENRLKMMAREPTEAIVRAIDAACHEHWPDARKMAVAIQQAIIDAAPLTPWEDKGASP